jgi:hypothetical protein
MLAYHGSAHSYRAALISKGEKNVAEEEVYRKIISEYNNKNNVSHDWYKNLKATAATFLATLTSSKSTGLPGYIQFCTDFPKLEIILFMEKQLQCINKTSYDDRILHCDATGSLTKISHQQKNYIDINYQTILNYFCLLKNKKHLNSKKGSVMVAEFISSGQALNNLSSFFLALRCQYERIYRKKFAFRTVVTDFSWPLMNSVCEQLNFCTMIDYSKHVFEIAKNGEFDEKMSYLTSCISHTMKRLTFTIKSMQNDNRLRTYFYYIFSLLVNSTTLEMSIKYFRLACIIFMSSNLTKTVIEAKEQIALALNERPETLKEFEKLIEKKQYILLVEKEETKKDDFLNDSINETAAADDDEDVSNSDDESNDTNQANVNQSNKCESNEPDDILKDDSIKRNSPFTKIYIDIQIEVSSKINEDKDESIFADESITIDQNEYYWPELIEFLQERWMPYAFIWMSFTLRDTGIFDFTTFFSLSFSLKVFIFDGSLPLKNHSSFLFFSLFFI